MFKLNFSNAEVSRSFRYSCRNIWVLLTDTARWPAWGPSVKEVECRERFIKMGSTGRVKTVAGIWLPFNITRYEENRFWAWKVAGIPATGHRIEPAEEGWCRLTFEVPILAAPYAYICGIALRKIDRLMEKTHN